MSDKYLYGGTPVEPKLAAGARGVLLRDVNGACIFRVYSEGYSFIDYEIHHDDLSITIAADGLAAFYQIGDRFILDHDPRTLGLRRSDASEDHEAHKL